MPCCVVLCCEECPAGHSSQHNITQLDNMHGVTEKIEKSYSLKFFFIIPIDICTWNTLQIIIIIIIIKAHFVDLVVSQWER